MRYRTIYNAFILCAILVFMCISPFSAAAAKNAKSKKEYVSLGNGETVDATKVIPPDDMKKLRAAMKKARKKMMDTRGGPGYQDAMKAYNRAVEDLVSAFDPETKAKEDKEEEKRIKRSKRARKHIVNEQGGEIGDTTTVNGVKWVLTAKKGLSRGVWISESGQKQMVKPASAKDLKRQEVARLQELAKRKEEWRIKRHEKKAREEAEAKVALREAVEREAEDAELEKRCGVHANGSAGPCELAGTFNFDPASELAAGDTLEFGFVSCRNNPPLAEAAALAESSSFSLLVLDHRYQHGAYSYKHKKTEVVHDGAEDDEDWINFMPTHGEMISPQLRKTIPMWEKTGLLQKAAERVVFINAIQPEYCAEVAELQKDMPLGSRFHVYGNLRNLGLAEGVRFLLKRAKSNHVLFLERDFKVARTRFDWVKPSINLALEMLQAGTRPEGLDTNRVDSGTSNRNGNRADAAADLVLLRGLKRHRGWGGISSVCVPKDKKNPSLGFPYLGAAFTDDSVGARHGPAPDALLNPEDAAAYPYGDKQSPDEWGAEADNYCRRKSGLGRFFTAVAALDFCPGLASDPRWNGGTIQQCGNTPGSHGGNDYSEGDVRNCQDHGGSEKTCEAVMAATPHGCDGHTVGCAYCYGSRLSHWTNNPWMARREFIVKMLLPLVPDCAEKYARDRQRREACMYAGMEKDKDLLCALRKADYKIAQMDGPFEHMHPSRVLEGSGGLLMCSRGEGYWKPVEQHCEVWS